jgi:hypothetical protein
MTVRAWLEAFIVTVAVEAPIVLALTREVKLGWSKRLALIVFAQLATHPLVWFVFPRIAGLRGSTALMLSEAWAWLAEAVFYALTLPGVRPTRAGGVSALANGASVLAGVIIRAAWPNFAAG